MLFKNYNFEKSAHLLMLLIFETSQNFPTIIGFASNVSQKCQLLRLPHTEPSWKSFYSQNVEYKKCQYVTSCLCHIQRNISILWCSCFFFTFTRDTEWHCLDNVNILFAEFSQFLQMGQPTCPDMNLVKQQITTHTHTWWGVLNL